MYTMRLVPSYLCHSASWSQYTVQPKSCYLTLNSPFFFPNRRCASKVKVLNFEASVWFLSGSMVFCAKISEVVTGIHWNSPNSSWCYRKNVWDHFGSLHLHPWAVKEAISIKCENSTLSPSVLAEFKLKSLLGFYVKAAHLRIISGFTLILKQVFFCLQFSFRKPSMVLKMDDELL